MKRGDVVTVVTSGAYGKPRPALVVQADAFEAIPSVTVLPLTSDLHDAGLVHLTVLLPDQQSGLPVVSQVMVDKAITAPRSKVGAVIGRLDDETLRTVSVAPGKFLGLA